jgi:hypothetical protein
MTMFFMGCSTVDFSVSWDQMISRYPQLCEEAPYVPAAAELVDAKVVPVLGPNFPRRRGMDRLDRRVHDRRSLDPATTIHRHKRMLSNSVDAPYVDLFAV